MRHWKVWIPLTLLLACVLVGIRSYANGIVAHPERPVAIPAWTQWDFGTVAAGTPLCVSCAVQNGGGRRLIIHPVSRDCPCAGSDADSLFIPPGSTANLVATIDSRGLAGSVQVDLEYSTNDPELPRFALTLRADV